MISHQSINQGVDEDKDKRPFFEKFRWVFLLGMAEIIIILCYGFFTYYDPEISPLKAKTNKEEAQEKINDFYPLFQDIHVMIFIGFGFLMTFLKSHSWTSVGVNYFVAAWAIQVVILFSGLWQKVFEGFNEKINLNVKTLIEGDFGAAAVLISFGAVLGKFNPAQMIVLATIEMYFYSLNSYIGAQYFKAVDMGASMYIHTFGAYFGLAVAYWSLENRFKSNKNNGSSYYSNLFSFIGTIFLWMYWPSFNGAFAEGVTRHRVLVNTYLSMTGSCIVVFIFNPVFRDGKFSAESILNATLAGGVIIGGVSDMATNSWEAIMIGAFGGIVSLIGFEKLSSFLANKFNIYDTCGINNLHGIPGVFSGLMGFIYAALANAEKYGESLDIIFPAIKERSSLNQAWYQLAGLGLTLGIAIVSGSITGIVMRSEFFQKPTYLFTDREYFDIEGIKLKNGYDGVIDGDDVSDKESNQEKSKKISSDLAFNRNSALSHHSAKNYSQKDRLLS
jgi:ammonium transporter Rh